MAQVTTTPKTGSVGPSTFYTSTRYGVLERQRVKPFNPRSLPQQNHRGIVKEVTGSWRQRTETERAGWKALARQLPGKFTGYTAYVSANVTLRHCGLPPLTVAPPTPALGMLSCAGLVVETTPLVKLTQVSATFAPDKLIVEACPPVSAGVEYVREDLVALAVVDGPAGPPADLDLTAAYVARFGAPQPGQRVVVQLRPMKNGFKGEALTCAVLVTGP